MHALAADAKAAEAARKPSTAAGVLGAQVVIETGSPSALPLADWVADLWIVTDATDANLPGLSASEARRMLAPYRGIAPHRQPRREAGRPRPRSAGGLAHDTGGTVTITEDAGGLWAVVRMPPLAGGDDWSHYYHGPDGNPVSRDTAFVGAHYQLQAFVRPIRGARNFTIVAAGGRFFVANCSLYAGPGGQMGLPCELVARSLYNGHVLWRRPISERFGDMGSLLVATPERLYVKDGGAVAILDPETGTEIGRIVATRPPRHVRYLLLSDGVLLTTSGSRPFNDATDPPGKAIAGDKNEPQRVAAAGASCWTARN